MANGRTNYEEVAISGKIRAKTGYRGPCNETTHLITPEGNVERIIKYEPFNGNSGWTVPTNSRGNVETESGIYMVEEVDLISIHSISFS